MSKPILDDSNSSVMECWQCGGEGRVVGTCVDGCCEDQDDPYCDFCSHRCDVCNGKGSWREPFETPIKEPHS